MRVRLITHQFFPAYHTGVERLSLNLAQQLIRMGHDCGVVTSAAHAGDGEDPYVWQGVRVMPVAAPPADLGRPWRHDEVVTPRLRALFAEERPDVVHVMEPMRLPQAFAAAAELGIPVVAQISDFIYPCARITLVKRDGRLCLDPEEGHACVRDCGIADAGMRLGWARWALASAAAVVSPCRFTIDLHRSAGFDTTGWHHVTWGTDYAAIPPRRPRSGGRLVAGFLGTLLEHKGPQILVDALLAHPEANVEAQLYGASFHDQGFERRLRADAAGDERVRFLGTYDHAELAGILAQLDVVVIPSLWHENMPTVGLAAAAAGVPVVVSDAGGLRELVDDYACGLVFPLGDAPALGALLARLATDRRELDGLRSQMSFPPGLEEEAWQLERIYARIAAAGRG